MNNEILIKHQMAFAVYFAKLLVFINGHSEYAATVGEVERPEIVQKTYLASGATKAKLSMHQFNCAGDVQIFRRSNGGWIHLTKSTDYEFAGKYWESLDANCVWGGRFGDDPDTKEIEGWDGNHFQYGTLRTLGLVRPVDGGPRVTKT